MADESKNLQVLTRVLDLLEKEDIPTIFSSEHNSPLLVLHRRILTAGVKDILQRSKKWLLACRIIHIYLMRPVYRTDPMKEHVHFCIKLKTPRERLKIIKAALSNPETIACGDFDRGAGAMNAEAHQRISAFRKFEGLPGAGCRVGRSSLKPKAVSVFFEIICFF